MSLALDTCPALTSADNDTAHLVCCDVNTALCGADVTDEPWSGDDVPECPLCELLADKFPQCGPDCPGEDDEQ